MTYQIIKQSIINNLLFPWNVRKALLSLLQVLGVSVLWNVFYSLKHCLLSHDNVSHDTPPSPLDTYLLLVCPSLPSSPSPHEYTSPSADRARQCLPPEFTASFLMKTCWMDSSRVGAAIDSEPPMPSLPPAPYPVAYTWNTHSRMSLCIVPPRMWNLSSSSFSCGVIFIPRVHLNRGSRGGFLCYYDDSAVYPWHIHPDVNKIWILIIDFEIS